MNASRMPVEFRRTEGRAPIVGRAMLAAMVFAALAASGLPAAAGETFLVVKTTDMNHSVEYKIMSPDEHKELQAQIQTEARLFPKAQEQAAKDWKDDPANKQSPYPGGRLAARKVEVVERATTQAQADKKLDACNTAESKRQDAEQPRRTSKSSSAGESKQEKAKLQKEMDLQKACDLVRSKLDALVADEKEKAAKPDAGAAKPDAPAAKPDVKAPLK